MGSRSGGGEPAPNAEPSRTGARARTSGRRPSPSALEEEGRDSGRASPEQVAAVRARMPYNHPEPTADRRAVLAAFVTRLTNHEVGRSQQAWIRDVLIVHGPGSEAALERGYREYGWTNLFLRVVDSPPQAAAGGIRVVPDFIRDDFVDNDADADLIGGIQPSPTTKTEPVAPTAPSKSEPMQAESRIAAQDDRDSSSGHIEPLTAEELLEETADLDRRLRGQSPASVDPEVAWRIEAMRPQYPADGAIPLLRARPDRLFDHDVCVSCGSPLSDRRPRCGPCVEAVNIVVAEHP
jgi:hypothetical protein